MPGTMINFPVPAIIDGLLSYLQWSFSNIEVTPSEYRWNIDDRKSLVRICAPFVIDNEKPMSAPFIVLERGGFTFDNRIIGNLKSGESNTFANSNYTAIADGTVNIICGSGVASEASSLANFIAILLQANRHAIIGQISFLRNMYHLDIGPEIPVVKDAEVRRWEVTLRIFVSLQMGWVTKILEPQLWTAAGIYGSNVNVSDAAFSEKGSVTLGSDLLVDSTKDFGPNTSNDPQLLEQELDNGWYSIRFKDTDNNNLYVTPNQLYTITEVVDNHTLKLLTHDTDNQPVAWAAPNTAVDLEYDLVWNHIHLKIEIPNNNS